MDELAVVPAARGRLMQAPVAGHRVGWNATTGLLYAEGHPSGEPEVLCAPGDLSARLRVLEDELRGSGVPVPEGVYRDESLLRVEGSIEHLQVARDGFGGVRRCDATVDFRVATRVEGLAILAGVAAMATTVPRAQAEVRYAKDGTGTVETVYLRGSSGIKVLGRWYDKGLESYGPGRRGLRIRVEDQRRYPKGHRRDVDELTSDYVSAKFQERFLPMWRATKGVTVAGQVVLVERIADLEAAGELTPQRAEQLAGYLALRKFGTSQSPATHRRRRQMLRERGLVEAGGGLEDVEVDLHVVLEQALERSVWGAEG